MAIRVFEYFSEFPSLLNYKMTDESRQLAEENYRLFLYMFNKYKQCYSIIADSDFDEHIDIFYLVYCKQCHVYVTRHESKHKLSTYLDKAFKSICEQALTHYNTGYMQQWRNSGSLPLDKMTNSETYVGELIADGHVDIATQYETVDLLNRVLDYIDSKDQTTKQIKHFNCNGWRVLKEWYANSFDTTPQFLTYLKSEGLACEDTTADHIRKVLSYHRGQLKGALERGEI